MGQIQNHFNLLMACITENNTRMTSTYNMPGSPGMSWVCAGLTGGKLDWTLAKASHKSFKLNSKHKENKKEEKARISRKQFPTVRDVKKKNLLVYRIFCFKTKTAKVWFHTKETQEYSYIKKKLVTFKLAGFIINLKAIYLVKNMKKNWWRLLSYPALLCAVPLLWNWQREFALHWSYPMRFVSIVTASAHRETARASWPASCRI